MEKLTINYRFQDYLEANRINWYQNKWLAIGLKLFSLLFFILSILTIGLHYVLRETIAWFNIGLAIFFLLFIFYEWTILPWTGKRLFNLQKKYFNEVYFSFEEHQIIEITSFSKTKFSWIYKYVKTSKILLIYTNPTGLMIIPKKYCASEEQYEKICNIVANFPQGY